MIKFIAAVVLCICVVDGAEYYNVLSIDGGGIRGIISAQTIIEMENYAYNYSLS